MSSVFGLNARPSSAIACRPASRGASELRDHAPLLQLVDLDHRVEQLEVVARVAGELLERGDVLGEARAAEADAGLQELRADAVVQAHALGDLDDVGAGLLAQTLAISLMKEIFVARNALEASLTISALLMSVRTSGGVERRVELDDGVAGPVAVVADDDAVGLEEVLDRRALLEELRAGDVAEAPCPARRRGA